MFLYRGFDTLWFHLCSGILFLQGIWTGVIKMLSAVYYHLSSPSYSQCPPRPLPIYLSPSIVFSILCTIRRLTESASAICFLVILLVFVNSNQSHRLITFECEVRGLSVLQEQPNRNLFATLKPGIGSVSYPYAVGTTWWSMLCQEFRRLTRSSVCRRRWFSEEMRHDQCVFYWHIR